MISRGAAAGGVLDGAALAANLSSTALPRAGRAGRRARGGRLGGLLCAELPVGLQRTALNVQLLLLLLLAAAVGYAFVASSRVRAMTPSAWTDRAVGEPLPPSTGAPTPGQAPSPAAARPSPRRPQYISSCRHKKPL